MHAVRVNPKPFAPFTEVKPMTTPVLQHPHITLPSLTQLDRETGPAAVKLLTTWILDRKTTLTSTDLAQAERVVGDAYRLVSDARHQLGTVSSPVAGAVWDLLDRIVEQLTSWLNSIRGASGPALHEACLNGLRQLSRNDDSFKQLLARISQDAGATRSDAAGELQPPDPVGDTGAAGAIGAKGTVVEESGAEPPQRKTGRPPTVHEVVRRIAELRQGRARWKEITDRIRSEFNYAYELTTLKSYWRDRHSHLPQIA